jgi:hypothetical protein
MTRKWHLGRLIQVGKGSASPDLSFIEGFFDWACSDQGGMRIA